METATFNVPSISCSACSSKIEQGIGSLKGIQDVSINLKTQSVKVDYNPSEIQPKDIKGKISSMGYEVIQ